MASLCLPASESAMCELLPNHIYSPYFWFGNQRSSLLPCRVPCSLLARDGKREGKDSGTMVLRSSYKWTSRWEPHGNHSGHIVLLRAYYVHQCSYVPTMYTYVHMFQTSYLQKKEFHKVSPLPLRGRGTGVGLCEELNGNSWGWRCGTVG